MILHKEKNRLYKTIRTQISTNENIIRYKHLKKKLKKEIRLTKSRFIENKIKECGNNSKKLWKEINKITPFKKQISSFPDTICNSQSANKFNTYFSTIGERIVLDLQDNMNNNIISDTEKHQLPHFYINITNTQIVSKIIRQLNNSNAIGMDGINTQFIKDSVDTISPALTALINLSITTNKVPIVWKTAIVQPIYKNKGEKSDPANYRPISILPVSSKIMEKVVCNQITSHLENNHILSDTQFGFRDKTSTSNALNYVCNILYTSLDRNKLSLLILLDLSKAFDSISHAILIDKLKTYNMYSDWFADYLSGRQQITKISAFKSDLSPVEYGIPQGSVLGPVLFNLFLNDINTFLNKFKHDKIELKVINYADDTQLIFTSEYMYYKDLCTFAENTTNELIKWFTNLSLKINVNKTQCMLVTSKAHNNKINSDSKYLNLNGSKIFFCDSVLNLGVAFDSDMKFKTHVDSLYKKVNSKLLYLNKTRKFHNYYTRKLLVQHLALAHLNYCREVWGFLSSTQTTQIQRLINFGSKIIFCRNKGDPASDCIKKLKWFNAKQASDFFVGCSIFKEIKGHTNTNVKSPYTLIKGTETRKNVLRYSPPDTRTNYGKRNLNYRAINLWNCLPQDLKHKSSLNSFKFNLKCFLTEGE